MKTMLDDQKKFALIVIRQFIVPIENRSEEND